jgi:hypothetical protein
MPAVSRFVSGGGLAPRVGPDYNALRLRQKAVKTVSGNSRMEKLLIGGRGLGGRLCYGGPSSSTDGSRVAFNGRKTGQTALYLMNSDGTGEEGTVQRSR